MTRHPLRVFLTGGTGYVGAAVAQALLARGHRVTALVRAAARAAALPPGCMPIVGDLASPAAWLEAAADADVAVHAGFQYAGGVEQRAPDWIATAALLAIAEARAGRLRRVVYSSNAYLLGDHPERPVDEHAVVTAPGATPLPRLALEQLVAGSAAGVAIRLGMVYGAATGPMGGTISRLFDGFVAGERFDAIARLTGRWSLVHVRDAADLYVAVVEGDTAATGVFHATDGTPILAAEVLDLAREALIGSGVSIVADTAGSANEIGAEHLGRLAHDVAVVPVRALALGWSPRCSSFRDGAARVAAEWRAERGLP